MSSFDSRFFERAVLTGVIECDSELHIGSGYEEVESIAKPTKRDSESTEQQGRTVHRYADVALDRAGQPMVPASSLRGLLAGALRAVAQRAAGQPGEAPPEGGGYVARVERLLGGVPVREEAAGDEAESGAQRGGAGALRVYDARVQSADVSPPMLQAHVSIDPVSGAAADHRLFARRVVPRGTRFHLRLELDRVDEDDLRLLRTALATLDGGPEARLGKAKGAGKGAIRVVELEVRVLDAAATLDWLLAGPEKALTECLMPHSVAPLDLPSLGRWARLELRLTPCSPLLVNDPLGAWCSAREPTRDFIYMRRDGRAVIPGETLKGLARAHCRRILTTLGVPDVEAHLERLFGGPEVGMGCVRFEDALDGCKASEPHLQTFNAVDRFTGGVRKGALFEVEAAMPEHLDTVVHLDLARLADRPWAKGLLLLLLRDAFEEDLAVGWGKGKGYGALRAAVKLGGEYRSDWLRLWRESAPDRPFGADDVQAWVGALEELADADAPATVQEVAR